MIYLDNAATYISLNEDVISAYTKALKEYPANSNSSHRLGYLTNKALEESKTNILKALKLNTNEYEVIFNSGASEGVNHAIKGYAYKYKNRGNEIIAFVNEHPSVNETLKELSNNGFKITFIKCDENGEIIYDDIKKAINKNTIMVCVMSVNNEVGSVNDLKRISKIVKDYPKCIFFSDVTQSIGKIKEDYSCLDMFACSAHKFGGLIGSGILIKKKKIQLQKLIAGGVQEYNNRSGTVATPLHISSSYALVKAIKNIDKNYEYVSNLNNLTRKLLKDNEEIIINSNSSFPYIINISLMSKKGSVIIEGLSNKEIYISSLSACNKKTDFVSSTLLNMGRDSKLANNSLRISFSTMNKVEEIKIFIKELNNLLRSVR